MKCRLQSFILYKSPVISLVAGTHKPAFYESR